MGRRAVAIDLTAAARAGTGGLHGKPRRQSAGRATLGTEKRCSPRFSPPSRKKRPNKPEKEDLMRHAVIVSTARTPLGRAYRGAFNDTQPQALAGHAIAEAVKRARVAPGEVDDVIIGAAIQQGAQGFNIARQSALRAGLPETVAAMSVDRQCASGMMAIAIAAKEIIDDGMNIAV